MARTTSPPKPTYVRQAYRDGWTARIMDMRRTDNPHDAERQPAKHYAWRAGYAERDAAGRGEYVD